MHDLYKKAHDIFLRRDEDETTTEEYRQGEKLWDQYADEYELNNKKDCPKCAAPMRFCWCVWGCCCPKKPYEMYCDACGISTAEEQSW